MFTPVSAKSSNLVVGNVERTAPSPLSSDGHSRAGFQPWTLACSGGQEREVVAVEARTTQGCLQWQWGLSGSLLGWQDNLSERDPRKSCTCLKQTLGKIVMPQPNRPITKCLFMCLSLWAPEHHFYPNFYYHICPDMQPPCQTEQFHAFFPPSSRE